MKLSHPVALSVAAVLTFSATLAQASYPAGVWVKAQSVEFEPSAAAPTRIRIHGVALLYEGPADSFVNSYTKPARGMLYYECPPADVATCVSEWQEIVANMAQPLNVCVGLGDQTQPTGTLRRPDDTGSAPDVYPIQMGVLEGHSPCGVIQQFLLHESGAGSGGAAGAGAAGSSGSSSAGTSGNSGAGAAGASAGSKGSSVASAADNERGCSFTARRTQAGLLGLTLGVLALLGLRRRRPG